MTNPPDCPFCLENNLLKGEILYQSNGGFVIPALGSEGNFLIIPKLHSESPGDVPDDWWTDFKLLFEQIPMDKNHYNVSLNVGQHAGQTVKHLHFWIIPRQGGMPASGKGLAALVQPSSVE